MPRLAKSLIISTGAIAKRLWLPGEEAYRQKGVSACAVCDGALPIFRDKELIVIWWGDSACEEASFLTKYASKVHLLVRKDKLRASKIMQERVMNHEKIQIHWNTEWTKILGDGKLMTWLEIVNNKTKEASTLAAGWLFYAIGHKPNTEFLAWQVALDEVGYIQVKTGTVQTSIDGVFAAGDVQDKHYRQAVTSAWTGCMAAMDAEKWLEANE
jgi:thioredoxin reductase (NADPH)